MAGGGPPRRASFGFNYRGAEGEKIRTKWSGLVCAEVGRSFKRALFELGSSILVEIRDLLSFRCMREFRVFEI